MQKFELHKHDQTLVQLQETMQVATTLQTEIGDLREWLLIELNAKVTQLTQELAHVKQQLTEATTLAQSHKAEIKEKIRQGVLAWKSQLMNWEVPDLDSPERSDVAAPAAAAAEAAQPQPVHKLARVSMVPPRYNGAAASPSASATAPLSALAPPALHGAAASPSASATAPPSATGPAASFMDKKLWLWDNTDDHQLCLSATVIECSAESIVVKIDNRYGQDIWREHTFNPEEALKALEIFDEEVYSKNPDQPLTTPHKFKVLTVNDSQEAHHEIKGTFIRSDDIGDTAMWQNERNHMFLWQDVEMYWFLGPSPHDKMYKSARPARWAHEARLWQDVRDTVRANVTICFKAYLVPPLPLPPPRRQQFPPPPRVPVALETRRAGLPAALSAALAALLLLARLLLLLPHPLLLALARLPSQLVLALQMRVASRSAHLSAGVTARRAQKKAGVMLESKAFLPEKIR